MTCDCVAWYRCAHAMVGRVYDRSKLYKAVRWGGVGVVEVGVVAHNFFITNYQDNK